MKNNRQRTVIYARVSKDDQNPENQIVELKDYISRNKDMELIEVYKDEITGSKDSRPELDRLGRHTAHMLQIVEEWHNMGINFTITTLGIDTRTPVGWFVFGLLAQVAELERQFIVERTNLRLDRIRKEIEKKGYYITKDGKKRTSLGRAKGKKDSKIRRKRGYFLRDYSK